MSRHYFSRRLLSLVISSVLLVGIFGQLSGRVVADDYRTQEVPAGYQLVSENNPFIEWDIQYQQDLNVSDDAFSQADASVAFSEAQDIVPSDIANQNGYILKFKAEASLDTIYDLIKDYDFEVIGNSSNKFFSILTTEAFGEVSQKFESLCEFVEEDELMLFDDVDINYTETDTQTDYDLISTPNDPYLSEQWHLSHLNIDSAWNYTTGTSSIKLAVIDSGIYRDHPDLINSNIMSGYDFYYDVTVFEDRVGHGTAVTGIIAATTNNSIGITGISPNISIVPLCVASADGSVSESGVTSAIYFAADSGCDVINLSLGGNDTSAISSAIEYAYNHGCIIIASAGNSGTSRYNYPASLNNVISVGSINRDSSRSTFSNFNDKIDVVAPGEDIFTTDDPSKSAGSYYGPHDGTSFSAPCVSAIAGLVVSFYPSITPTDFENLVKTASIDIGAAGYDIYTGYGVINASGMIQRYSTEKVWYQTHVQDIGWQGYVCNGAVSGTSAQSKRLEAIRINLENISGGIEYRTHVQDVGWQGWVANDALSGTSAQSKRLEAIQIRLTGDAANKYDVYYRVHAENTGWMGWAKNGEASGTAGYSYRLEAIEIRLVTKGGAAPGSTARAFIDRYASEPTPTPTPTLPPIPTPAPLDPNAQAVLYKTHIQDIGWQPYYSNGESAGTSGHSKRMESIQIKLQNIDGGIEYSSHVQDIGWMNYVANDAMSGTSAQSKRLEAIKIRLTGSAANAYDVYYCVHAQDTGWLDWAKNGAEAGTAGFSYRLEAIKIVLVPKGGAAPGPTARPFVQNQ